MERALEDDLKGLDAEIELAVDRLFVEDQKLRQDQTAADTSDTEPSPDTGRVFENAAPSGLGGFMAPAEPLSGFDADPVSTAVSPPAGEAQPFARVTPDDPDGSLFTTAEEGRGFEELFEKLESRLLTLECNMTRESLAATRQQVMELRDASTERDTISVLQRMEYVLETMSKNEPPVHPSLMKFLVDAKNTVRLITKEGPAPGDGLYKALVLEGIEARFHCLHRPRDMGQEASPEAGWKTVEKKLDILSAKIDQGFGGIRRGLSGLERPQPSTREVTVTVLKVDERFFGVESDRVFKLFKLPGGFRAACMGRERIRVKDVEIRVVDLSKILPLSEIRPDRELRLLILREDEEYLGLIIEQVIQKVSSRSPMGRGENGYFMGSIPWTYEERPVDLPVLDVKRL
jgi:hypothetical protein